MSFFLRARSNDFLRKGLPGRKGIEKNKIHFELFTVPGQNKSESGSQAPEMQKTCLKES